MMFTTHEKVFHLNWMEDITLANIEEFRNAISRLIDSEATSLILNVKGVQYVNSAALGAIADAVMKARKNQKELVITETQQAVREIFDIVKFSSFIKFFESDEAAFRYFKMDEFD